MCGNQGEKGTCSTLTTLALCHSDRNWLRTSLNYLQFLKDFNSRGKKVGSTWTYISSNGRLWNSISTSHPDKTKALLQSRCGFVQSSRTLCLVPQQPFFFPIGSLALSSLPCPTPLNAIILEPFLIDFKLEPDWINLPKWNCYSLVPIIIYTYYESRFFMKAFGCCSFRIMCIRGNPESSWFHHCECLYGNGETAQGISPSIHLS